MSALNNSDRVDEKQTLTRRRALKRLKHFALGSSTVYLAMAANYQKPSFKKMFNMEDAAAQTTSSGDTTTP